MMYMVIIIDHLHHLKNESKILVFTYNSDQTVYNRILQRENVNEVPKYSLKTISIKYL